MENRCHYNSEAYIQGELLRVLARPCLSLGFLLETGHRELS